MIQILLDIPHVDVLKVLVEDLKGIEKKLVNQMISLREKNIEIDAVTIFQEAKDQKVMLCYMDLIDSIDKKKYL